MVPGGSTISQKSTLMSSSIQDMQMKKNHEVHDTRVLPGGAGLLWSVTGSMTPVGQMTSVVLLLMVGLGVTVSSATSFC